jgi:predicted aspartyl protease
MAHIFDPTYRPPFPTLPVIIHNITSGSATPKLTAYVDTGSDGTLVPITYLRTLNAVKMYPIGLRSHWGQSRTVFVYSVDIEVAGHNLPGINVVADDKGAIVLLGRNVLNRLILLLDGPRTQTDVLTRRPPRL